MELTTLINKINEIKKRSNLVYDLRRKEMATLSKELKENEEILYVISFYLGLTKQYYLVLTPTTLYMMKKKKIIERLPISSLEMKHTEYENESVGKVIIKSKQKEIELNLYNMEIKRLVQSIKGSYQELSYEHQFVPVKEVAPLSKKGIALRASFVIVLFFSIIGLILFLMLKFNLL